MDRLLPDTFGTAEVGLLEALQPRLEKSSVRILRADIHQHTHVIDLTLLLPSWSDRELRHEVLHSISELERQLDHAVTTNPTFIWGEADPDA